MWLLAAVSAVERTPQSSAGVLQHRPGLVVRQATVEPRVSLAFTEAVLACATIQQPQVLILPKRPHTLTLPPPRQPHAPVRVVGIC